MPDSSPPRAANPLLVVLLGALVVMVVANVLASGFQKLGMPEGVVVLVFTGALAGSLVNIPLWQRDIRTDGGWAYALGPWVYYQAPSIRHQVIAINAGGALVPLGVSAWLLTRTANWDVFIATAVVAVVARMVARVVPGEGITMPVVVAPLASAAVALILAHGEGGGEPAAVAYIGGSIGTLIGADLLNLHRLRDVGPGIVSIGGAGVFDGVFLVGLVAAALA